MKVSVLNKVREGYRRANLGLFFGEHQYEVSQAQFAQLQNDHRLKVFLVQDKASEAPKETATRKKKAM